MKLDTQARTALIVGVFALVALAFALGRISAPSSSNPQPLPSARAEAGAELEASYPHSRSGASLAAAAFQRAFADPAILRPGVLRRRIDEVATPAFARKMLETNRPGTQRLIEGPVGAGVAAGIPTVYFSVPVAYKLLSYTPRRARVQMWGFTMVGNVATVEPSAYFGTGTTNLVWQDGRWKIAWTQAAFGPTPRTRTPRRGAEGFELGDLARGFHLYGILP